MMEAKSKDKKTVPLISKIGPLAGLLAAAITVFSNLPIMLQYIMVLLLALITFVSIYAVFGEPVIKFVKKKRMAKKHRILTKKYSEKFNKIVDRFVELIKEDHSDTILYILNKLRSNTKYAAILPSHQGFRRAYDVFYGSMGKLPRTKENFLILVRWFESIVNLCNEHLICRPVERIRTIGREGIPEHVREDYERCKAIYDRFIDDYMDFAKDMNKQFAENVARDYFQVPKGL
jgi:hypothetical protein